MVRLAVTASTYLSVTTGERCERREYGLEEAQPDGNAGAHTDNAVLGSSLAVHRANSACP